MEGDRQLSFGHPEKIIWRGEMLRMRRNTASIIEVLDFTRKKLDTLFLEMNRVAARKRSAKRGKKQNATP